MLKFAVLIGRFSPWHKAHRDILNKGLEVAEKVIIVIGSHNRARNTKLPWTSEERIQMIKSSLPAEHLARVEFICIKDFLYSDPMWIANLQYQVGKITNKEKSIALVGYHSDETSYYLSLFKDWKFVSVESDNKFHATEIRDKIFSNQDFSGYLHSNIKSFIETWQNSDIAKKLVGEHLFLKEYAKTWTFEIPNKDPKAKPKFYVPTFQTVDSVVIMSGHILLIKRGGKLGQGLLALPGGFLNNNERLLDGAIRELKEETKIRVSEEELLKHVKKNKVFDHPQRSLRGRLITHAFLIDLGIGDLPYVKGSDDAEEALWLPLGELSAKESEFFDDHYYIIQHLISNLDNWF